MYPRTDCEHLVGRDVLLQMVTSHSRFFDVMLDSDANEVIWLEAGIGSILRKLSDPFSSVFCFHLQEAEKAFGKVLSTWRS